MEYEFEPGLIDEPEQYDLNGLVAAGNALGHGQGWALKWYPARTPQPTTLRPFSRSPSTSRPGSRSIS